MIFPIDPQRTNNKQKLHPLIVGVNIEGKPLFGYHVDTDYKILGSSVPVVFPVDPVRSMVWCDHCEGKCQRIGAIFDCDELDTEDHSYRNDTKCYVCLRDLENSDELDRGTCDICFCAAEEICFICHRSGRSNCNLHA